MTTRDIPATIGETPALPLSERQRCFVIEYLKNGANASKAATAAGYAPTSARQCGARLLALPQVRDAIERLRMEQVEELRERLGVTLERALHAIACAAFADPRRLFNEDGTMKAVTELDDDTALAIESIEVIELKGGEEGRTIGHVKKLRFARRSAAQDMLMKHLNAYKEDNKSKGEALGSGAIQALLASMGRSVLPVAPALLEPDHGV